MKHSALEKQIGFVFWLLGLAVAWQAVRFCQGHAPIPGLAEPHFDPLHILSILPFPFYYMAGIILWLSAAILTMLVGQIVARLVVVGWKQLCVEMRESWADELRLARIESDKAKRRELRRKLRTEKSGGDTAGALVIGAIIGALFF